MKCAAASVFRVAVIVQATAVAALSFTKGQMGKVQWIGDGKEQPARDEDFYTDDPAPAFCTSFAADTSVRRVELRIAGLGLYRADINGERVGRAELAPLWTPFGTRVLFDSYDLTKQIKPGENTLVVRLGNGWYNPLPLRMWGRFNLREHLAVGRPALAAEIEVVRADGRSEVLRSDESWRVADTPLLRNNLYLGEVYDARCPRTGEWRKAVRVQGPKGKLVPNTAPQVVEIDAWPAVAVNDVKPGVCVADMGRNFAGVASFRLGKGVAGERITFRYGERVYGDGTVNTLTAVCGQIKRKGMGGPGAPDLAEQTDVYIRSGAGEETYQPRFTWHAFRYVQIEGLSHALSASDVVAHAWASDVKNALTFECSDARVNTLHAVCRNTFTSNLMGVQSDCPGRERFGYGGDIAVSAEAYILNYDMHDFYLKTLQDYDDEAAADGFISGTAPFVGFVDHGFGGKHGDAFGWALGVPILIEKLVRYYGDVEAMRNYYPMCARYLEKTVEAHPDLVIKSCNGDHEAVEGEKPDKKLTVMAHFHQFAKLAERFAQALGKPEDAKKWKALAERIRALFQTIYIVDGKVAQGRQAEQIFGLYHRLIPDGQVAAAERILRDDLAEHQGKFTTGIFGTQYLADLCPDLVERNVTRNDYPSFGHMIDKGATTLWETWKESDNIYSQNHPMFGSVDAWIVQSLLGIRVADDALGADKIIIAPCATRAVDWAKGEYRTVKGVVGVAWQKVGDRRRLTVNIPEGVSARVQPQCNGEWVEIKSGRHAWK